MTPLPRFFRLRQIRCARERLGVVRLPTRLVVLSTLLAALFVMAGGALPAAAHGSHSHVAGGHASRHVGTLGESVRPERQEAQAHAAAAVAKVPHKVPEVSDHADCCCGGLMCHASVTLTEPVVPSPEGRSERLVPVPSSGVQERAPSGLERPPRRAHSA